MATPWCRAAIRPMRPTRFLYKNLAYDPVADFEPVTLLTASRTFLIVPTSVGVSTVKELLNYAKRRRAG